MGDFSPVVFVLACSMDHGREDVPMSCRIASKLVCDEFPRRLPLMFQGPTKEAFSGSTVSALGDQNIDHVPILIDGSPQVVALASDLYEQFIDVPDVAEPSLFSAQRSSIGRAKLPAPKPNSLVGNNDTPLNK